MKNVKLILLGSFLILLTNNLFSQAKTLLEAFNTSIASEKRNEINQAIDALKLNYDPKCYESNIRLGWLYYKSKQYKEAMNYYDQAINLKPNSLEAQIGVLNPMADIAANSTGEKELDVLMAKYKKVLELNPNDINSNYQLGFYYYNRGNFDNAKIYFTKIIELYPSGYDAFLRAAWAKITKEKPQSDNVIKAFNDSYAFEAKGDYFSALAAIKDINAPQYYDLNLRLGWLYYMTAQYVASVKYYQQAIDLKPNSIEARLAVTYPALALLDKDFLFNQYKKIIELDPLNSTAYYQLGLIYYCKEDYTNAFQCFDKIVNYYPFTYDGLLMLAWTDFRLGKKADAEKLFNKVLLLSPYDTSALHGIALLK